MKILRFPIEAMSLMEVFIRVFAPNKKSPGNVRCAGLNPSLGGRRRHLGNTYRRIDSCLLALQ
jgi:hypothetical protein